MQQVQGLHAKAPACGGGLELKCCEDCLIWKDLKGAAAVKLKLHAQRACSLRRKQRQAQAVWLQGHNVTLG